MEMGKLFSVLFCINLLFSTTAVSRKTLQEQFDSAFDLYLTGFKMVHSKSHFNIKHLLKHINLTTVLEYY